MLWTGGGLRYSGLQVAELPLPCLVLVSYLSNCLIVSRCLKSKTIRVAVSAIRKAECRQVIWPTELFHPDRGLAGVGLIMYGVVAGDAASKRGAGATRGDAKIRG